MPSCAAWISPWYFWRCASVFAAARLFWASARFFCAVASWPAIDFLNVGDLLRRLGLRLGGRDLDALQVGDEVAHGLLVLRATAGDAPRGHRGARAGRR